MDSAELIEASLIWTTLNITTQIYTGLEILVHTKYEGVHVWEQQYHKCWQVTLHSQLMVNFLCCMKPGINESC